MNTMKTFFHPLYGVCVDFSPRQGPKDIVGTTEIGYMKVTICIYFDSKLSVPVVYFAELVLKVRKFQNENMESSHCPKYERINLKNSALNT